MRSEYALFNDPPIEDILGKRAQFAPPMPPSERGAARLRALPFGPLFEAALRADSAAEDPEEEAESFLARPLEELTTAAEKHNLSTTPTPTHAAASDFVSILPPERTVTPAPQTELPALPSGAPAEPRVALGWLIRSSRDELVALESVVEEALARPKPRTKPSQLWGAFASMSSSMPVELFEASRQRLIFQETQQQYDVYRDALHYNPMEAADDLERDPVLKFLEHAAHDAPVAATSPALDAAAALPTPPSVVDVRWTLNAPAQATSAPELVLLTKELSAFLACVVRHDSAPPAIPAVSGRQWARGACSLVACCNRSRVLLTAQLLRVRRVSAPARARAAGAGALGPRPRRRLHGPGEPRGVRGPSGQPPLVPPVSLAADSGGPQGAQAR
jgi:hypothetical protein